MLLSLPQAYLRLLALAVFFLQLLIRRRQLSGPLFNAILKVTIQVAQILPGFSMPGLQFRHPRDIFFALAHRCYPRSLGLLSFNASAFRKGYRIIAPASFAGLSTPSLRRPEDG
jgi:hypothetical protein